VKRLFSDGVTREEYGRYLLALYCVYQALEEQLAATSTHPALTQTYFPILRRQEALAQDLDFFFGERKAWMERLQHPGPSPAVQSYVQRLRHLGRTNPTLLIAHSYTRYLGDLSGLILYGTTIVAMPPHLSRAPATSP